MKLFYIYKYICNTVSFHLLLLLYIYIYIYIHTSNHKNQSLLFLLLYFHCACFAYDLLYLIIATAGKISKTKTFNDKGEASKS